MHDKSDTVQRKGRIELHNLQLLNGQNTFLNH